MRLLIDVTISVKICGVERIESVDIAVKHGAEYIGFVFYPPSPRNLTLEKAAQLIYRVPKHITRVGLFVDPTNSEIKDVLTATDLDLIQLHGQPHRHGVRGGVPQRAADPPGDLLVRAPHPSAAAA